MLRAVTPISAQKFSAAIIMPNTDPPIQTLEAAAEYKKEILAATPAGYSFEPLMTFYLTKELSPAEIEKTASASDKTVYGVKYYPYGATTNSQWGYRDILEARDVLAAIEKAGVPLLMHGEVHVGAHGEEADPYDGENLFLHDVLPRLIEAFPNLKLSLEHLSTVAACEFLEKHGAEGKVVGTVTPHHLMYSRDDAEHEPMLRCKPLIKSARDRDAIRALIAKGYTFVIGGTDSAPHPESKKRSSEGAFGVFSAPAALEIYTQIFEDLGALDKLETFLSLNGPKFYGLTPSTETITLEKKEWRVPEHIASGDDFVLPMLAGETLRWQVR